MLQNAKLKNLIKLSSRITVYVPSTVNVNEKTDTTEYVNKTHELLSRCFGGATETKAIGSWISDSGLVKEKTTMIFSFCKDVDLENHIEEVIDWCEIMKKELTQEAIAMELNGELYFI